MFGRFARSASAVAPLAIMLAGCVSPIVLTDPKTGQMTQCLATGAFPLINQQQCAASYENLGWVRTTAAEAQRAQQQRVQQRDDEVRAAAEECRGARLRGELKTYVASVQCSNPRIRAANAQAGYPFMDLLDIELAARLSNAEKIDKGETTEADAGLRSAELHSKMVDEGRRRLLETQAAQNQATMAQAAQTQAQGALLTGLGTYNASIQQPRSITCTTFGPTTRCY